MKAAALLLLLAAAAPAVLAGAPQPPRFGPNEGQVLEVDREALEVTIRHGYLPELDMEPMAMVFRVADPRVLDRIHTGDRVKFKPGLVDGRFGVLSIERLPAAGREGRQAPP